MKVETGKIALKNVALPNNTEQEAVIMSAVVVDDERNIYENTSTNGTFEFFYFYEFEQFTVLWILFIVIIAGNLGVLYTLIFGRSRKSRMNYFITHLALADLSVGLISVLTDIVWKMTVSWLAGNILCKTIRYLQVVVTYASTYVLVALSIDRYDAIRHPMKFSGSWKRAKFLIITAWLLSATFSIPMLVFYEEKLVQGVLQCWIEFDRQWKWQLYITLVSILLFVIPTTIIASCYTIIIITIWKKSSGGFVKDTKRSSNKSAMMMMTATTTATTRTDRCDSDNSRRASSRGLIPKAKVKTIKITFVIVSVFIICWSPYIVFDLLQVYGYIPQTQTNIALATFVQSLAPLNSAANPIIYCLFSTHFCRTLKSLPPFKWFVKKKNRKNGESMTTNTQSSSLSEFLTHHNKARFETTTTINAHSVLVH